MLLLPIPPLEYDDVIIRPKRTGLATRNPGERGPDIRRTMTFVHSRASYTGIPIVAANMDTVATFAMANALKEHGLATALHKFYSIDELVVFFRSLGEADTVFYSMGMSEADVQKFEAVYAQCPESIRYLCLDVANGYMETFVEFVKRMRQKYPHLTIMAGNVATPEMTETLIIAGADIVKVGIGPGSVCTTRIVEGCGYPQLTAVIECADAAHGLKGMVCADGGCVHPGHVAIAFGAGADFVMLGGMLAGYDEGGGEIVKGKGKDRGKTFRKFYGMSSEEAMMKHYGGVAKHRAPEGKLVLLPARGAVEPRILEILGGLRGACTMTGSWTLKELPKRTSFVRVKRPKNDSFDSF